MSGLRWILWIGLFLATGLDAIAQEQTIDPSQTELTATLRPGHPRLLFLQQDEARLAKNGQTFRLRILAPANHAFEELDDKPRYSQENQNEGYTKLAIRIQSPGEKVVIAVQMGLELGEMAEDVNIVPLCNWAE